MIGDWGQCMGGFRNGERGRGGGGDRRLGSVHGWLDAAMGREGIDLRGWMGVIE